MTLKRPCQRCECCKQLRPSTIIRLYRAGGTTHQSAPLCDACWADPAPSYERCQHGVKA